MRFLTWQMTFRSDMAHASESGHWYDREGNPVYQVEAKKGGMRDTTLRDARVLKLYPSVTTIIKVAAAPGLERWKMNQAVMSALTHPGLQGTDADIDLILRDAAEQGRKAAERGTNIHAAIQGHYEGESPSEEMMPFVQAAIKAVGNGVWDAEASFSHPLGYGGKVDLSTVSGVGRVIDFKTKEFGPEDKMAGWPEQAMQLAAYRVGLGMPKATCANVFVSVTNPGLAVVHEWSEEELAKGWEKFQCLLSYWQIEKGYKPCHP